MKENHTFQLMTVAQFATKHPAFSQASLRHLIFDAQTNGFDRVVMRIGRKILLEENSFFKWLAEQQNGGGV